MTNALETNDTTTRESYGVAATRKNTAWRNAEVSRMGTVRILFNNRRAAGSQFDAAQLRDPQFCRYNDIQHWVVLAPSNNDDCGMSVYGGAA